MQERDSSLPWGALSVAVVSSISLALVSFGVGLLTGVLFVSDCEVEVIEQLSQEVTRP